MALSANSIRPSKDLGRERNVPVAGSTRIYAGALVMCQSDGYYAPAAAAASNRGVQGVAMEEADNSSGADGAVNCRIREGVFLVNGTTLAQASVDALVYAEDDETVDETQGTNEPVAGVLDEVVSASSAWVKIGQTESKL